LEASANWRVLEDSSKELLDIMLTYTAIAIVLHLFCFFWVLSLFPSLSKTLTNP